MVPSNTTLLGLVKHVTYVEGVWFDQAVTGHSTANIGIASSPATSFALRASDTIASVQEAHQLRCEISRRTMADLQLDVVVKDVDTMQFGRCNSKSCENSLSTPATPTSSATRF